MTLQANTSGNGQQVNNSYLGMEKEDDYWDYHGHEYLLARLGGTDKLDR